MEENLKPKDGWDKAGISGQLLGQLLIPLIIGFFGYKINNTLKKEDARLKLFESALDIQKYSKTDTTLPITGYQNWARKYIEYYIKSYSEVPITENVELAPFFSNVIELDTLVREGEWYKNEESNMSMFINNITTIDGNIFATGTIIRPGTQEKFWGPYSLPNAWQYGRNGNTYSMVVRPIEGNTESCKISVYRLYENQ